jgi:hypothetical protein
MSQTVVKDETLHEFARLADLLQEASLVVRRISHSKKSKVDFWERSRDLRKSFTGLNEKEIDGLISEAVVSVRKSESSS